MNTFLKTVLAGAAGLGALYVVARISYNLGKEVAEVERQLESPDKNEPAHADEPTEKNEAQEEPAAQTEADEPQSENKPRNIIGRTADKLRNARILMNLRKNWGKRKSGVLGSLLTNPDGARIEARIKDGGVQINVSPAV